MKPMTAFARFAILVGLLALLAAPVLAQANDLAVGKAKEFIELLHKGDYNGAYARVDSNLGFKATPDTFKGFWQNLTSKAGAFVEFKQATVDNVNGSTVVTQVVKFEKGHVDLKIALDNNFKVSGLQMANHKAAAAPQAQSQAPPAPAASPAPAPAA